jgi:hypothetical protein
VPGIVRLLIGRPLDMEDSQLSSNDAVDAEPDQPLLTRHELDHQRLAWVTLPCGIADMRANEQARGAVCATASRC